MTFDVQTPLTPVTLQVSVWDERPSPQYALGVHLPDWVVRGRLTLPSGEQYATEYRIHDAFTGESDLFAQAVEQVVILLVARLSESIAAHLKDLIIEATS